MNTSLKLAALLLGLSTLNSPLSTALAQGSLTPPAGAPAPVMKSLDQIEARRPISSLPFTITQSGSYYLTTNLSVAVAGAITISANGVTLDLNGFTLSSTAPNAAAGGFGILLNGGWSDITIRNGHIRGGVTNNGSGVFSGPGFAHGINYVGNAPRNVLVSHVTVSGCNNHGIYLSFGNSSVVESCGVRSVGQTGVLASAIKQSTATDCGQTAIEGDIVADCRGVTVGISTSYKGIKADTVHSSYGHSPTGYGISASTALNCVGESAGGAGLQANSIATGCLGTSISGVGLAANIANGCRGTSDTGTALSVIRNVNSFAN